MLPISLEILGLHRGLFDREVSSWVAFTQRIERCKVGVGQDRLNWNFDTRDSFTCKFYFLESFPSSSSFQAPLIKAIWNFKIPRKVKFFLWTLCYRSLNTSDRIQRKLPNWSISPCICRMCYGAEESLNHLFILCSFARNWLYCLMGFLMFRAAFLID